MVLLNSPNRSLGEVLLVETSTVWLSGLSTTGMVFTVWASRCRFSSALNAADLRDQNMGSLTVRGECEWQCSG